MTKKPRVKKDAFDWVDRPTEKPEVTAQSNTSARSKWEASTKAAKTKSTIKATSKVSESAIEKQRTIFVAYNKATGDIVATQELMLDNANDSDIPWSGIPDEITAKSFKLIGKLSDKELIEIHANYKVTGSGELELKQS